MPGLSRSNSRKVSLPIGTIFQTMAEQKPNWLLCDGSPVPEGFSDLSAIMDSVPDLRPRNIFDGSILSPAPGEGITYFNPSNSSYVYAGTYIPYYIIGKL